jgi:L-amino acid N-acyltransferase YncA
MIIRDAQDTDLPGILGIYNDVVTTTTAIYDQSVTTLDQRRAWFEDRRAKGLPVLVAVEGGEVVGFSSFGEWRSRWGYRFTVEHSVHVRADCRGRGYGRVLIEALFPRAVSLNMHAMIGAIDSASAASLRLHEKLGFVRVGHYPEVAHKFGRWLDLVTVQKTFTGSHQ